MSLRAKPSRAQVKEAERVFGLFRAGQASGWAIREGRMVRSGPAGWLGSALGPTLGMQLGLGCGLLALLVGVLASFAGLFDGAAASLSDPWLAVA